MYPKVEPRAVTCSTCGNPAVHPRLMKVKQGDKIVTEAHWVCPRCSNRFMIGTVSIDDGQKAKN